MKPQFIKFEDLSEVDRRRFELEGLKVFSTSCIKILEGGRPARCGDYMVALDWELAQKYAPDGHTIDGEVVGLIDAPEMDSFIEATQRRRDEEWEATDGEKEKA